MNRQEMEALEDEYRDYIRASDRAMEEINANYQDFQRHSDQLVEVVTTAFREISDSREKHYFLMQLEKSRAYCRQQFDQVMYRIEEERDEKRRAFYRKLDGGV